MARRPFLKPESRYESAFAGSESAYGLFVQTIMHQEITRVRFGKQLDLLIRRVRDHAVAQWEGDTDGSDLTIVNARGHEILRSSTLLMAPEIARMFELMMAKHEGQTRKADGADYRAHPLEVSHLLRQYGYGPELIAAGLGHDLLEDTATIEDEIWSAGGDKVLALVKAMTNDNSIANWWEQKQAHLKQVAEAGEEATALLVADHIANLRSLLDDYMAVGEAIWPKLNASAQMKLNYELWTWDMAREYLDGTPLLDEYRRLVEWFRVLLRA